MPSGCVALRDQHVSAGGNRRPGCGDALDLAQHQRARLLRLLDVGRRVTEREGDDWHMLLEADTEVVDEVVEPPCDEPDAEQPVRSRPHDVDLLPHPLRTADVEPAEQAQTAGGGHRCRKVTVRIAPAHRGEDDRKA